MSRNEKQIVCVSLGLLYHHVSHLAIFQVIQHLCRNSDLALDARELGTRLCNLILHWSPLMEALLNGFASVQLHLPIGNRLLCRVYLTLKIGDGVRVDVIATGQLKRLKRRLDGLVHDGILGLRQYGQGLQQNSDSKRHTSDGASPRRSMASCVSRSTVSRISRVDSIDKEGGGRHAEK